MRFRPLSRDGVFFDLYAQTAAQLVVATGLLARMLGADLPARKELAARLGEAEHAADDAAHELQRHLARTFVTPFDRDDMYQLAVIMDDCVDLVDEAGDLIVLTRLGALPAGVTDQVAVLQRCAELTVGVMPHLRSRSMERLRHYWVEINRLENQADTTYRQLVAHVFERETDPVRIIKLKGVIDALESCADAFELLANKVETIVLRES